MKIRVVTCEQATEDFKPDVNASAGTRCKNNPNFLRFFVSQDIGYHRCQFVSTQIHMLRW